MKKPRLKLKKSRLYAPLIVLLVQLLLACSAPPVRQDNPVLVQAPSIPPLPDDARQPKTLPNYLQRVQSDIEAWANKLEAILSPASVPAGAAKATTTP